MTKIVVIDTDVPLDLGHELRQLTQKVNAIMATVAQLEADIAAQTQAISGLQTAATNQLAAIQALRDQIAQGGGVSDADLATLEANTQAIVNVTSGMTPAPTPAP